jgi:tetratricopeptide (TPR) repeat protein
LRKALEIDEGLGEAHAQLGYLKLVYDWDTAGADREFQRALRLSPNSADVIFLDSMYKCEMRRFDEGIAGFQRAAELDPTGPQSYQYLGFAYYWADRLEEAAVQEKKALDLDPHYTNAKFILIFIEALKGRLSEAAAQADRLWSTLPPSEDATLLSNFGWLYGVAGQQEKARTLLKRILDIRARRYVDAFVIAGVYAGLGEKEKAFEWLDRAYEEHAGQLVIVKVDRWIDNLRSDPRYARLLKKMNFGE